MVTSCASLVVRRKVAAQPLLRCGGSVAWKSTVATTATEASDEAPTLVKIPTLPVLGSLNSRYSGTPQYNESRIYEFWPEMKRRFGSFYSMGMPGLGQGMHGTLHIIQDPHEMAKVLRKEGKFPSGAAELAWGPKKHFDDKGRAAGALIKNGPEWKRIRSFVQTDLLSPKSAQRYVPAAIEAAHYISRGAPEYADRMNEFLNIASFDMFSNIMLGQLPRVSDPGFDSDPEDALFADATAQSLRLNNKLMRSPFDQLMVLRFGYHTPLYKEFHKHFDAAMEIADRRVRALNELRDKGQLTPAQESSYANQALERQLTDDTITKEEAITIVGGLLPAGVDTTGGMLSWKMLHLAAHPEVQDRIHGELIKATNGGELTEEAISSEVVPFLYAFMRESHRVAPPTPTVPLKIFRTEIEVHGVRLPPGTVVALDCVSTGQDPNIVEDPDEFRPERFLKEAVKARKGTPMDVIDHSFFSGPFSQGARRCPGSRVANMEGLCLLAQLILDWKMNIPSIDHWKEVPYGSETLMTAYLPKIEFSPRA